jgi:hypothetical protein
MRPRFAKESASERATPACRKGIERERETRESIKNKEESVRANTFL